MTLVFSVGGPGCEGVGEAVDVWVLVVEFTGGEEADAVDGEAKWIVSVAGPSWSSVRFVVMGMAGL